MVLCWVDIDKTDESVQDSKNCINLTQRPKLILFEAKASLSHFPKAEKFKNKAGLS